jgi:acylphosphatase
VTRAPLRLHLRIRGRVQGVWFREATRQEAERLAVRGWVRNCADGSVEALLEGDAASVRELEQWCHHGPPAAHVVEVLSNPEPVSPDRPEGAFRVVR